MYKILSFILLIFSITNNYATAENKGLITFKSEFSVTETLTRLKNTLNQKQFKIFNHIDHAAGAQSNHISLNETHLIIFGNPKIGSLLIQCNQSVAIDLPQKALIWKDKNGLVWLSFNNPKYLLQRHQLKECEQLTLTMANALTKMANDITGKGSNK